MVTNGKWRAWAFLSNTFRLCRNAAAAGTWGSHMNCARINKPQTNSSKIRSKRLRFEILQRGRKGRRRRRAWSCTDHSFTRWSFLFHRRDSDALLCSGCRAAVLFHQRWTLSPVMVNALWVEERAVTQGLDWERQNLINSSFEKTPHQTPFCTISVSTLSTDLTSKPDSKTANQLTQHQGEKWNDSPETQ